MDNKAIITQYLAAWGKGDADTVKALLAPDAITHVSATHTEKSIDFEAQACQTWVASFPDTDLKVEKLVSEGDSVTAYWVIQATHTQEFAGIPATHKQVTFGGLEIQRLADGKIVEIWRLSDSFGLMQQLQY